MITKPELHELPCMLYADQKGRVFEHPYMKMAGFSGANPSTLNPRHLIPMSEYSKLFFIPECPPIGLDPYSGKYKIVPEIKINGRVKKCQAVAAFLEPGLVRTHLPAADYSSKTYILPLWAYTAVGFKNDSYWTAGFRIEYNIKWHPMSFDDRKLVPAIKKFKIKNQTGPLVNHLINCATKNHCFAAKNLFLERWEAPLPISQTCNAACLGCLSLQNDPLCKASHQRISFKPSIEEIVPLAAGHLERAPEAIISFGQGCEGEPLAEYRLMADSIEKVRNRTGKGTINLNTNGSWPDRVRLVALSGLDSIRISLNSARPDFYRAYYRPKGYDFEDVVSSIRLARKMGLYTMINYLVFPGINDNEEEIEAMANLIDTTGVQFIHMKNLNIDPQLYIEKMPENRCPSLGMREMPDILKERFPQVEFGYFNKPVR